MARIGEAVKGARFGSLVVIRIFRQHGRRTASAEVRCDCGTVKEVLVDNLGKNTNSCGCERSIRSGASRSARGEAGRVKSPEYLAWRRMLERCRNPNSGKFHRYGGRGIQIAGRWLTYRNFLEDMGRRPSPEYSLERINNDGHYEPGNCKWATRREQANNRCTNLPREKVAAALSGYDSLPRVGGRVKSGELQRLAAKLGMKPEGVAQLVQVRKKEARRG